MLERRRPEQEVVDDGEDGGVRADPQREGQHGDEREAGTPSRAAQRVSDVADQVLQRSLAARVPDRLPDGVDAAEAHTRLPAGLARVHSRAPVLCRLHLQVEAELLRGLVALAPAVQQAA